MQGKIFVVGLGPGLPQYMTPEASAAIAQCDTVIGYKYYHQFAAHLLKPGAEVLDTGMKQERQRAYQAFDCAAQGRTVAVISSGDSGIYGMAPLMWEISAQGAYPNVELEVVAGISAFQAAAARLGAPIGHDFCCISLSDLLTPWSLIDRRIEAAAEADFITAIYNPKSKGRYWQLHHLREVFLRYRSGSTPVGTVRQVGREDEELRVTTLEEFDPETVDMFTVVIIGNSQTFSFGGRMITPRGYFSEEPEGHNVGQSIMIKSFQTIEGKLRGTGYALDHKWALIHTIHTSADFEMEQLLETSPCAIEQWHRYLVGGGTVITDVSMAAAGIRKAALTKYGITVKTYLNDERVAEMAQRLNITRTQAGIRLAVQDHPDALYAFGNAPTALIELTDLIRRGDARPAGIIAAPVGFVNVVESKLRVKVFKNIPHAIINGRKGGSSLAATIVNAAIALDDAAELWPGRDV